MNRNYDKKFTQTAFFNTHPEYLPFVGDRYEEHRILIVGESHYIGQTPETEKYGIGYFAEKWFTEPAEILTEPYAGWFNTRGVIEDYLSGSRSKGHLIFTNIIKSFSSAVLDEPVSRINLKESQKFNCFAFMNYFQMPSVYRGMKFWNALEISAEKAGDKDAASQVWLDVNRESAKVLDDVIKALSPELVIFTSKSAYYAYTAVNTKHRDDKNIFVIPHAGCAWWNKPSKSSNGKSGREIFEEILRENVKK